MIVISPKLKFFPMKVLIIYFIFTFMIFLLSDAFQEIPNKIILCFYVFMFYFGIYGGYWLGVKSKNNYSYLTPSSEYIHYIKIIIILGGLYYIGWGVNSIIDYGATSFGNVINTLVNPGQAYQNKFDVFENRVINNQVNSITQILMLFSYLSSIFVILVIMYWKKISFRMKFFAIFAIFIYILSYLYIGTQKGLGDVLIYFIVGMLLLLFSDGVKIKKNKKILIYSIIFIFFLFMFSYMVIAQGSRAVLFGQNSSILFNNIHEGFIAKNFGEQIAFGFYNTIGYPSHGYLGLSYNLTQDFQFSYGAGLSSAFESYRLQYFGGEDNFLKTYPVRTELATGWPAGMYWATAFPSFASDLTFFGTIIFMFIIGFIFARTWMRAIIMKDVLAYALLGQLFIFMFYLPANNQVLMQRQGFLIILSIVVLAIFRELRKKKYYV